MTGHSENLIKHFLLLSRLTPRQIFSLLYAKSHAFLRNRGHLIKNTDESDELFLNYLKGAAPAEEAKNTLFGQFRLSAGTYIAEQDKVHYAGLLQKMQPETVKRLREQADQLCDNHFVIWPADNLKFAAIDWAAKHAVSKEWLHSLNRFYFLKTLGKVYLLTRDDRYARKGLELILDWIQSCRYGHLITWQSMNISERVLSWLWFMSIIIDSPALDSQLFFAILKSIYYQTLFLRRHLEYRAKNNHLLFNARALITTAVILPYFTRSDAWLQRGLQLLKKEVKRQTLSDGFNAESCTGYQLWLTNLLFETVLFMDKFNVKYEAKLKAVLQGMLDACLAVIKPDGTLPQFGDFKDVDVDTKPADLFAMGAFYFNRSDFRYLVKDIPADMVLTTGKESYAVLAAMPAEPPAHNTAALSDVGYYVYRSDWSEQADYLCIDCGAISKLGSNPGHGHADALSFELSVKGHPFVIDSGTYSYDRGIERDYFRGTAAHNTVMVDNQNQSQLWDAFRIGKKAAAKCLHWHENDRWLYFCGQHNGYKRLSPPVMHVRHLFVAKNRYFLILDELAGLKGHKAEQIFHLATQTTIDLTTAKELFIAEPVQLRLLPLEKGQLKTHLHSANESGMHGWLSTTYHTKTASQSIIFELSGQPFEDIGIVIAEDDAVLAVNRVSQPPDEIKTHIDKPNKRRIYEINTQNTTDYIICNENKSSRHPYCAWISLSGTQNVIDYCINDRARSLRFMKQITTAKGDGL
jgi:hypothetical protein